MDEPNEGHEPEPLEARVKRLESRVERLERQLGFSELPAAAGPVAEAMETEVRALDETAHAIPLVGRAVVALAGALLLRALTEAGTLPTAIGVGAGIAYAAMWLVLAARTAVERPVETTLHSLTAALVLGPLLWEATVRFGAVPPWITAAVLVAFTVFGLSVSWRKNLTRVAWITTLAGIATAWALLIGTHRAVAFVCVLLAIAAAVEFCACLEHWLKERWLVAFSANLSVMLLTYLVTNGNGVPEVWTPIPTAAVLGAQSALLGIYLLSAIVRTLYRRQLFTGFEITQCVFAFLIGLGGGLRMSQTHSVIAAVAAGFTLFCGAACYMVSFLLLERHGKHDRNFYTYSTFAILLVLTGSLILLSEAPLAALWSAIGLVCLWLSARFQRMTLLFHGTIFLLLAVFWFGAGGASWRLIGDGTVGLAEFSAAAWISAAAAIMAVALVWRQAGAGELAWSGRGAVFLTTAAGVLSAAGLASGGLTGAWHALTSSGAAGCSVFRTAVVVVFSAALTVAGKRCRRADLVWLVYAMMAAGALRLLSQDLQQERTLVLFMSLLLYGGALILLPKLYQRARVADEE